MLAIQRFSVTGAIDSAFWLYRQHFKLLFTISLLVNVLPAITNLGTSSLGLAEHLKPGYAERSAMRWSQRSSENAGAEGELPPPESLPTLPLD